MQKDGCIMGLRAEAVADRQAIAKLSDNLQIVKCAAGQPLLRPGVPLDSMYIVQSGGMKLTPSAAFADEAVTAAAASAASDGKIVADPFKFSHSKVARENKERTQKDRELMDKMI